jgi:hypothetical protein
MNESNRIKQSTIGITRNSKFDHAGEYNRIKHDIVNMRRLSPNQKELIQHMSSEDKMYVIMLYDHMIDWFEEMTNLL